MEASEARSWLRCYRCWSTDLEVQVHYEVIHRIDPISGKRADDALTYASVGFRIAN